MKGFLILRLEAPLMSFGAPMIDQNGVIQAYPSLSLITGLFGNALGYNHSDTNLLGSLQDRIRYAARQDRAGDEIKDYQTVDLSQDFMRDSHAWTTRGKIEERKGGSASKGTHIRFRDYRADAVYTVAVSLTSPEQQPTLTELAEALQHPARPLFIGRKTCLPSSPLFRGIIHSKGLVEALQLASLPANADRKEKYRIWWPADEKSNEVRSDIDLPVTDKRDWKNQIHIGQRWLSTAEIKVNMEA